MELNELVQLSGLIAISFSLACAVLWLFSRLGGIRPVGPGQEYLPGAKEIAFLFDGDALIDASETAKGFFSSPGKTFDDLPGFLTLVDEPFPGLKEKFGELADGGKFSLRSLDGQEKLTAQSDKGSLRFSMSGIPTNDTIDQPEQSRNSAMTKELETLRMTALSAPFLVWRQKPDGTITWANNTYLDLSQSTQGADRTPSWPPARLFDLTGRAERGTAGTPVRLTTHITGEAEPRWFDCYETPLGEESLFTAVAADKVVKAEIALRDFVQTLTKTFAHLTVGLAIFDKQRRLALFNPALTDLTSLSASFLTSRPTFQAVLDRLREKQMIPEPKDYKSWRRQLFELEMAAANGTYEETWSLTNGQTFRVKGRPHPDGAVAFLFEDISAEISLTRRFRSEQKTSQAVLDSLDEAIAVFSSTGALVLTNSAYTDLWGEDTNQILGGFGIIDATRIWTERCAPSPVWGDAREYVNAVGERVEWSANVLLRDGRRLGCRFSPIAGGATLAGFSPLAAPQSVSPQTGPVLSTADTDTISA